VPRERGFENPQSLAVVVGSRDSLRVWAGNSRIWTFGPEIRTRDIAAEMGLDYVIVARWKKEALGFVSISPESR
jgi:hypothetical protein